VKKPLENRSLKYERPVSEEEYRNWKTEKNAIEQGKRPMKTGLSNLSDLFLKSEKALGKQVSQIWENCFWTTKEIGKQWKASFWTEKKTQENRSLNFEIPVSEEWKRPLSVFIPAIPKSDFDFFSSNSSILKDIFL
jgi:hypothetical protein